MAAPPPNDSYGYADDGGGGLGYTDPGAGGHEQPAPVATDHGAKKKKRGYAAQAFEFGSGANAAVPGGAPLPVGAQFAGGIPPAPLGGAVPPPAVGYGSSAAYPGQQPPVAGYGVDPNAPAYGAPPSQMSPGLGGAPAAGGYQPPDASYYGGASAMGGAGGGVAGLSTSLSAMQLGAGAPAAGGVPQHQQMPRVALNQLYPTDLMNQPFNVSELELPPPPIILPPNVSCQGVSFLFFFQKSCYDHQRGPCVWE